VSWPTCSAGGGSNIDRNLDAVAAQTLEQAGSASAAIFVRDANAYLRLAGVAGISGAPLDGLVSAVRDPNHPLTRTALDGQAGFDVTPIAAGGPALRSHVPLLDPASRVRTVGVLALAHQLPLTPEQRKAAMELADDAARQVTSPAP